MLQAETSFKIIKDAIVREEKKVFLHQTPYFLMPGTAKFYVQGPFHFFPLTNCCFRARITWWHTRQSARKQWIMEKTLKIPTPLGCAAQPSMKAVIWTLLISAGSVPRQQDPGWLLLAQPPVSSVFWTQKGLISSGASPCRARFCLGLSGG